MADQPSALRAARGVAAFVAVIALALSGWQLYKDYEARPKDVVDPDVPFAIKDISVYNQPIPYESFRSRALYDDYFTPLFEQLGMVPDEVSETSEESWIIKGCDDADGVSVGLKTYGSFSIPYSRYHVTVSYYITEVKKESDVDTPIKNWKGNTIWPITMYGCSISFAEDTREYKEIELFSDSLNLNRHTKENGEPYKWYELTDYIFRHKHMTQEVYDKLKELFDDYDVKERLYLEKQIA